MAAAAVFGTAELLEAILLELPIKDLLMNAQRVSTTFNTTIQASTRLQQALFFKPLPGPPLNLERFNSSRLREIPSENVYHTVIENPFYDGLSQYKPLLKSRRFKPLLTALQRQEASWRRMLVTQPPITTKGPNITIRRPIKFPIDALSSKVGHISIWYHPVEIPRHVNEVICGLSFGAIEDHCPPQGRIGGKYSRSSFIPGTSETEDVHYAWEVRRITGPKPDSFSEKVKKVESGEWSSVEMWRPFDCGEKESMGQRR